MPCFATTLTMNSIVGEMQGFRFRSNDVELVSYHLKWKLNEEACDLDFIPDVNIYKFSPCDLPLKSCLGVMENEWYFFCPVKKKNGSIVKSNRSTETDSWKSIGNDKSVKEDNIVIGKIKTLVYNTAGKMSDKKKI